MGGASVLTTRALCLTILGISALTDIIQTSVGEKKNLPEASDTQDLPEDMLTSLFETLAMFNIQKIKCYMFYYNVTRSH